MVTLYTEDRIFLSVYIGALFADFTARHYLLLLLRRRPTVEGGWGMHSPDQGIITVKC